MESMRKSIGALPPCGVLRQPAGETLPNPPQPPTQRPPYSPLDDDKQEPDVPVPKHDKGTDSIAITRITNPTKHDCTRCTSRARQMKQSLVHGEPGSLRGKRFHARVPSYHVGQSSRRLAQILLILSTTTASESLSTVCARVNAAICTSRFATCLLVTVCACTSV